MNIFELLQPENLLSNQSLLDGVLRLQSQWITIKSAIDRLFQQKNYQIIQIRDLWRDILQNSQILIPRIFEYYFSNLDQAIETEYLVNFQRIFKENQISTLLQGVDYLLNVLNLHKQFLDIIEGNSPNEQFYLNKQMLSTYQYSIIELNMIQESIGTYFEQEFQSFKSFLCSKQENYEEIIAIQSPKFVNPNLSPEQQFDFAKNKYEKLLILSIETNTFQKVIKIMNLILSNDLKNFIQQKFDDDLFQNNILISSINYLNFFQISYIRYFEQQLIPIDGNNLNQINECINSMIKQIEISLYENFSKISSEFIFEIILEYPESYQIILEIKEALIYSNMVYELGESLTNSIQKRLLIPGVITMNILNQYINILKILQILDPKGLIFMKVTNPLQKYLLNRSDTLRCIIQHLTEDSQNYTRLIKEYVKIPSKELEQEISSDEDEKEAEKWEIQQLMNKKNHHIMRIQYQQSDLVSVLVNLYGSQEDFLTKYQNMLAEKLLGAKESNLDEEIKNLELLKLRFGESNLQPCNIIIKDINESKRINKNIHQNYDKEYIQSYQKQARKNLLAFDQLNVMFVSKSYWPINYEYQSFRTPNDIQEVYQAYQTKFSKLKAMRKLIWHNNLGSVNLILKFDNGDFEFTCLPIHAIIIRYFDESCYSDNLGVSSEYLSKELRLSQNIIKQKMVFWVQKQVIREFKPKQQNENSALLFKKQLSSYSNQYFSQNEQIQEKDNSLYFINSIFEGVSNQYDEPNLFEENEHEMILQDGIEGNNILDNSNSNWIIEGLIIRMLQTNGPKSAQKIHSLLKTVYKTNIPYICSENQTNEILRNMTVKQKVSYHGELYSAIN